MFDKLFGLPAHPLLIHAPIVLLPIAAVMTVVLVARPNWRKRAGWWPLTFLALVLVLLFAAKESGEGFNEGFDVAFGGAGAEEHAELAESTFALTVVWFVVFAVLTVLEQVERVRTSALKVLTSSQAALQGVAAVGAVLGVLATIWLVRTGHEGARITWGPVTDQIFPAG